MDEDKDFGVFGVNLNKKENRIHGKGSSHIKHHSLADRYKVTNAKIQHIKSQVLSNTCFLGNQKKTLNVPAVKKVGNAFIQYKVKSKIIRIWYVSFYY